MLLHVLAFTYGALSPLPSPITVDSRLECLSLCYRQRNCSSFFYRSLHGSCHLTDHVYAVQEESSPSSDIQYFVLTSDKCTSGYIWYRSLGLCYRYIGQPKLWQDAENNCQSDGGHLITVDSPKLNDLMNRISTTLYKSLWLGGWISTESAWFWADGSPILQDYWDQGRPTVAPHYCMHVSKFVINTNWRWRDHLCTGKNHTFICSMPASSKYLC